MQGLVARFPIATFGQSALIAKLEQLGIDYQGDIRPLLGNPIVFGLATATPTGSSAGTFLGVWATNDSGKLSALVKKIPSVRSAGSRDGAALYRLSRATDAGVPAARAHRASTAAR